MGTKVTEVFFIAKNKEGLKKGSYEAVTPCPKDAEEIKSSLGSEAVIKRKVL